MKETIKAIINHLDAQNGGGLFIGDCGKGYDYPVCRDEDCMSLNKYCMSLNKCGACQKRHAMYEINKNYLDHIKELYEKETSESATYG
jgi:hypothetical protein